jgi:hypothetical protein
MVTFLFLFAPVVVLIAIWIVQRFHPKRDRLQETLIEHVVGSSRIEPRFSTTNEIADLSREVFRDEPST